MKLARPILGFVSLIAAWALVTWLFAVPTYISPGPFAVARAFVANLGLLLTNLLPTAQAAIGGFVIGNIAAVLLATLFVHGSAYANPTCRSRFFSTPSLSSRSRRW